jgi:outer membrane protein insertion porin family
MMRFMILVLILGSLVAKAEEPQLSGLTETDIKRLRKEVPAAFTGDLSMEEVDDVVRALALIGSYERVVAEMDDQGRIHVVAKPVRTIRQISVTGQESFSERELRGIVELEPNSRFERKKVIEAGERLKQFYGERGFFNTIIEVSFARETASGLSVVFHIEEKLPCIVQSVAIETENAELKDRLSRLVNRLRKKPLATATLNRVRIKVADFLHRNRFLKTDLIGPEATYNADKTQAKLTFRLQDPFRYEFLVLENEQMNDSEIYRSLSPDTIERGTADPATEAADRIRQTYLRKGYPNVEVQTATLEIPETFTRRIKLTVTENQRVRISEIRISGRVSRPNSYYEDFIFKNSSPLVRRGYYNRQDLEKGYENLVNELRNQGYLRAKVQSSRVEYTGLPGQSRVILVMDEGPLTQLRTITFTGAISFSHDRLAKEISLKANSPLRLNDLEKSLDEIIVFYRSEGFLEARVLNNTDDLVQYNERGTQANVRIDIFEGPKVVVDSITIEGNSFTQSYVILRTIDIQVGEILTPKKIDEAEIRMNRLGIFQRAAVRTMEEGTNVSRRKVVISVTERDPGLFRLGTGVSSERDLTLRGFLGLSYNNLFGTGRGISGRAEIKSHVLEVNYPQYELVAGYLEPFLFNSLTRGRVNLTRSERVFDFKKSTGYTQITVSNKVDFFLERDFGRHWRASWKLWSLDARREFERYGRCTGVGVSCKEQQVATIGPLVDVDYRDNDAAPTRGHHSQWNLDYSHPNLASSEKINFLRMEAGHKRYYSLGSPKVVFASSLRGGYLVNLSDQVGSGVPTSHAFFLGGVSTIRGFGGSSDNERLPPNYELEVTSSSQLLIKTDSHYFLLKNELRFPIVGEHGGVIFYDGGMVKVTGETFDRPYRDAVGVGYRYNTPVGPFSLDIGFKINPRRGEHKEDPFRVHFSWGYF